MNQAADTFDGNGDSFRQALRELSQTAGRLGDSRTDLFGTVRNLQVLINALSNSNEQIDRSPGSLPRQLPPPQPTAVAAPPPQHPEQPLPPSSGTDARGTAAAAAGAATVRRPLPMPRREPHPSSASPPLQQGLQLVCAAVESAVDVPRRRNPDQTTGIAAKHRDRS